MGDVKTATTSHAAAAALTLQNGHAAAHKTPTQSVSAPPTPHLGPAAPAAPVPQLSPTPGGRVGRRLHTKVLEELKNAATRKSPAINPSAAPTGHAPLPSPLNLHAVSTTDGVTETTTIADDTGSPRIPGPAGKSKNCNICERSFTVFRPKHTCKICGKKICDDCSKNRIKLNRRLERRKGSRLCDACARDHIQLSTPLMSPTEQHVVDEENEQDDRSRGNDEAKRAMNGLNDDASQGSFAPSSVKSSIVSSPRDVDLLAEGASYLRPRHWLSLVGLVCVLFTRLLRFQALSVDGDVAAEARGFTLLLISLANWMDHLASVRVICSYLLGLVVYDEFTARSQRKELRQVSQISMAPQSSAHGPRRPRTRSSLHLERSRSSVPSSTTHKSIREREDEEVLEVEVGDKHADDGAGFSFDKLQTSLVDCTTKNRTSDSEMKMSCFLAACDHVCGFILVFGRATAFAASTVTGYMSTITTNLATWPVPASAGDAVAFSWKEQSVRAVVLREVELHVAATGGKKKPSCSRCVLRLLWFIEFVEACVRYTLLENMDEHCAAGASKAYEETIGARHPWIIRKGVNSALASLPTRSAIIKALNLHELSPEDSLAQLKKVQTNMRAMLDDVTALLKEYNLLDIK